MVVTKEFLEAFENARPEVCEDCDHLSAAAKASYELAIFEGKDIEQATADGLSVIDATCIGMVDMNMAEEDGFLEQDNQSCITNSCCGKPELVCSREKKEKTKFLLLQASGIRLKLMETD